MKSAPIGSMMKLSLSFFILLALCLLNAGLSFAQQAPDSLTGKWHSEGVYCAPITKGAKATRTKIIQTDLVAFEPDVTIDIYNKQTENGPQTFLRKSVGNKSCTANDVAEKLFLDVTFASNFYPAKGRGDTVFKMKSTAVTSWFVNKAAFRQCGDIIERNLLVLGISIKYPGYFFQEAKRTYSFVVGDNRLHMVFNEPEICKHSSTIMVLNRANP